MTFGSAATGPASAAVEPGALPVPRSWAEAVRRVIAEPERITLVFQPIVDLAGGSVAGYEALARFPPERSLSTVGADDGTVDGPPDRWFAVADKLGVGAELEACVVRAVLAVRGSLPAGRFVTVNVSPHLLHQPPLTNAFAAAGSLAGVVIELTEHLPVDDLQRLDEVLSRLRAAGAAIALDDAGSGYSGLQQLALVRPDIVKLDRSLVEFADRDEAKLALAELLGIYAGRLDACLLVEGVERLEELAAFLRLGVPLAQGWLFGAGTTGWSELSPAVAQQIRSLGRRARRVTTLGSLMEPAVSVDEADGAQLAAALLTTDPGLELVIIVDDLQQPVSLVRRGMRHEDGAGGMVVSGSASVPDRPRG